MATLSMTPTLKLLQGGLSSGIAKNWRILLIIGDIDITRNLSSDESLNSSFVSNHFSSSGNSWEQWLNGSASNRNCGPNWRIFVSYWCRQIFQESKPRWIFEIELHPHCIDRFFLKFVQQCWNAFASNHNRDFQNWHIFVSCLCHQLFQETKPCISEFELHHTVLNDFFLEFVWTRLECFCEQSQLWSNQWQCRDDNLCKWWSRGHNSPSVLL